MPTSYSRAAARTGRYRDRTEAPYDAQRPYGAWYPLVRLGHFLMMAAASCLIILAGLAVLGAILLLIASASK